MSKNTPIEQGWDEAVHIVTAYMQAEGVNPNQLALKANLNRSIISRFLSKKSFPDPSSVLALYIAIQERLDRAQKLAFQRAAGLEKLLSQLEKNAIYLVDLQPEIEALNPYKAGLQQMAIAETNSVGSWEEAIFYYRKAEELFARTALSHAAKAACQVVQMQINLGSYSTAHQEIERIQKVYAKIQNAETQAEIYRLQGWIDFHLGNFHHAIEHFERQLSFAQEAGVEHAKHSAHGFLGRIYLELAQQSASQRERTTLLHKARQHSELDRLFFIRQGWFEGIAMSTFRLSQVLQISESHREAKDLRKCVRNMIGKRPFPQLDIEEARLHLDDKELPNTKFLVDRALDYLEDQKYARGISQSLQLLAVAELRDGQPADAFEVAIAALCAAPAGSDANKKRLWDFIKGIDRDLIWAGKWKSYTEYYRHLKEAAVEQSGNFAYLHYVAFSERNETIEQIFAQLEPAIGANTSDLAA